MAVDFVSAGTAASGIADVTVSWGSHSTGNLGLLLIETNNSDTVGTPSGWTAVSASPVTYAAQEHKLSVFYRVAASGAESSVTITDPGNHWNAQILVFSGNDTSSPIEANAGTSDGASGSTATAPAVTTTSSGCGIVHIIGTGRDANTTAQFDSWTNSNLASITEIADYVNSGAGGGGFGAAWGLFNSTGSTGTGTVTQAAAGVFTAITIAIKPASSSSDTPSAASSGSFSITGSAANGLEAKLSAANSSSYTLTGSSAAGLIARSSAAGSSSYTITGVAASGVKQAAGDTPSAANSGSFTISGVAASGVRALKSNAETSSYTITGSDASGLISIGANAEAGIFSISGSDAQGQWIHVSDASSDAFVITGIDAIGVKSGAISLTQADLDAIAAAVWADATAVAAHAKLDAIIARLTC